MKVAIIGGGAAGFFAAFSVKAHYPNAEVVLYEKTSKLLAKVKISGGGRCNVTHACFKNSELVKFYPRGSKQLKKTFEQFSTQDTVNWFENRGVELKTEQDNRMFPVTDDSQTIIDLFLREARESSIRVNMKQSISNIESAGELFKLKIEDKELIYDKVIVATGGSPKLEGFEWLKKLGHEIDAPVPSLFTFNMPKEPIKMLMGISVEKATVKVLGTKLEQSGPLLITHWGMSGPAILKTSAWGAKVLNDLSYDFQVQINWANQSETEFRETIEEFISSKKLLKNLCPIKIPQRLWEFLLEKSDLSLEKPWLELGKKGLNKLVNTLTNDQYKVDGKTTFKEEFVTAGGLSLSGVDFNTMQSRKLPGLYFAGEVLNVDGVTGGFNFQAAWSTGFVAGKLLN